MTKAADADHTVLHLRPRRDAMQALKRYCTFWGWTMTRFLEQRARDMERSLLTLLTPAQARKYLAGLLTYADLDEREKAALKANRAAFNKQLREYSPPPEGPEVESTITQAASAP
jgi:hypothetical protein